jgi:Uma2 family endonuclease
MSGPGWFDDLPEFMTEAEYRELPEEISRAIEIVHGHVIKCESPVPRRGRIARRLATALEAARSPADPCLTVETDVDVALWRVPRFTFRRPDVVVYRCIDDPTRKPSAQETVLVVEVTSPTTAREDLVDKRAQYATAGIPLYLVVVLDEKYDIWEIREFHLDAAASAYRLHAVHHSVLELEQPVRLTLPIPELVTGLTPPRPTATGRPRPRARRPLSDIISEQRR